jgi:hypothetical protein
VAIAIAQSLATAVDVPNISADTTSWTPGVNDLCLCFVALRGGNTPAIYVSNVTGNGLTWVNVVNVDDTQAAICMTVWRAQGAAPTAGPVTVTWGTLPISASIQIHRLTGTATSGTSGSGAIGATGTADNGTVESTPATTSLTTTAANSRVLGFAAGRSQTFTQGSGYTAILKNQTASSGGNVSRSNSEYKDVASPALTTVDFSTTGILRGWVIAGIEILVGSANTVAPAAASVVSHAIAPTIIEGSLTLAPDVASVVSSAVIGAIIDGVTLAPDAASVVSSATGGEFGITVAARMLTLPRRNQLTVQG